MVGTSGPDTIDRMTRLLLFFANRPWLALGLLIAASVLAATQLAQLEIKISANEMLVEGDPERAFFEQTQALFGDETVTLLVLEDPRPLEQSKLGVLRDVLQTIEGQPFVARTESLFSTPHVRSIDGYLEKSPYLANLPETAEAETALLGAARGNPLLDGILVSPDHPAIAVAIVMAKTTEAFGDEQITDAISRITRPLAAVYENVYSIGFARVRSEIAGRIVAEQGHLMPLAVAALLLALFLLLRQVLDILTPLITAGVSVLWTFGLMGWLGIPINVVTSTIPILLLVVGSTEDIHLLAEFRHAQRTGDPTKVAIRHMARKMGRTVFLTFITTWAGFLSVGLTGIEVLSQFGLIASTGLLFNFIATVVFIPAALALAGHWKLDGRSALFERRAQQWAARYWKLLCRHRRSALIALTLITALALTGMPRITLNHNAIDSLGPESGTAADIRRLNERFAGLEAFSVVLDSGIEDTFLHARYFDELIALQRFIQSLDPALSVTSFADYLTVLNRAFLEDETLGPPASNDEISELMIFLDHARVSGYITDDYSRTRIVVRHGLSATADVQALLDRIRGYLDTELDRGLDARLTGDSVLSISAARNMVTGQLQSVLLILVLFIAIITFIFTDLRVGLLAALPNIFPILVLFGVMGYAGIPLNIGTAMAAAVAIGIAVDDTLHFMLRYNQQLRGVGSQHDAMQKTLYEEALPVVSTSLALICGFLVFTFSDFPPVAQFGLLGALVIAAALIADFVITPLTTAALRLVTLWEILAPEFRQRLIPESPLFRDMRPWQIRKFVLSSTLLEFQAGEMVYRQHDDSHAMYLVMAGCVEVRIPQQGVGKETPVVDQFGPGQLFGDVAVLAEEPRRTDAVAMMPTTLMVLTREAIDNVTFLHPFIASRLFFNLARDVSCRWTTFIMRVRRVDSDLVDEKEDQR